MTGLTDALASITDLALLDLLRGRNDLGEVGRKCLRENWGRSVCLGDGGGVTVSASDDPESTPGGAYMLTNNPRWLDHQCLLRTSGDQHGKIGQAWRDPTPLADV